MVLLNDIVEIERIQIRPRRNDEVEGLGSGQVLEAELATPLWAVTIYTPISEFDDGRDIRAALNANTGPGKFVYVYDPIAQFPRSDPNGTQISGASVFIDQVQTNGQIALRGLPANFVLKRGDFFHVDYSGRRGFFEISEDVTASADGDTLFFDTFPVIPTGVTPNLPITLVKPQLKIKILSGSLSYGTADSGSWKMTGFTIEGIQKL